MDNLLQHAYVEERCNACGGTYRVTLYDALAEHQVQREWHSPRHCDVCDVQGSAALVPLPMELVEELNQAWERVANAAADAGVALEVGP